MRPAVFGSIILTPVIWFVLLSAAGFFVGFFWPTSKVIEYLYNNTALNLGAWLGTIAIILTPLSKKGLADFREDFDRAYYRFCTEKKLDDSLEMASKKLFDVYKHAVEINPNDAESHYYLGTAYHNRGRYQDAIAAYKKAIRIKPDYAEAHRDLGIAYGNLGHYQEAVEALKEAIRIEPDYVSAHYNLGSAYLLLGDKDSALEEYKILKNLDAELANELFNLINK
jgi:tetratricopeptide (TPR) repeat protein